MKSVLALITVLTVNLSHADLASELASALKQSAADKDATRLNLQIDDSSVDAKWKTAEVSVLKESSVIVTEEVARVDANTFTPESEDEEIVGDEARNIAREVKTSQAVAKDSVQPKPVSAR